MVASGAASAASVHAHAGSGNTVHAATRAINVPGDETATEIVEDLPPRDERQHCGAGRDASAPTAASTRESASRRAISDVGAWHTPAGSRVIVDDPRCRSPDRHARTVLRTGRVRGRHSRHAFVHHASKHVDVVETLSCEDAFFEEVPIDVRYSRRIRVHTGVTGTQPRERRPCRARPS